MKNCEVFRGLLTKNLNDADIILTGIPLDKNASIGKGASIAPSHIRDLSIMVPALSMDGYLIENVKLFDNGDILDEDFKVIQDKIFDIYNKNKFNVFLGGDHSISIASERAFIDYAKKLNKIPVVIHFDAHPDICDIYEDNLYSHACPNKRSLDYGLKDENLTIIGARGFELQEVEFLKKHPKIDVFKTCDVLKLKTDALVEYLVNKYSSDKYLIHISYDIDINDPSYAPGTGTPEPFGIDNLTVIEIICNLIRYLNCISLDLVEVSPKLDINDITSYLAIKGLYEIFYYLSKKKNGLD